MLELADVAGDAEHHAGGGAEVFGELLPGISPDDDGGIAGLAAEDEAVRGARRGGESEANDAALDGERLTEGRGSNGAGVKRRSSLLSYWCVRWGPRRWGRRSDWCTWR